MNAIKRLCVIDRPIEVFVRHCYYSEVSAHKKRPKGFDRKKCFQNLQETIGKIPNVGVTFLLDISHSQGKRHFLHEQSTYPVIEFKGGSECDSFLFMMDYVLGKKKISEESIIYFLEDDYLHLPGWTRVLREAFELPSIDYVTLYDHKDKYANSDYQELQSKVFHTQSCHWRTTPSTTNTYAMLLKTLQRDEKIHRTFSLTGKISKDHEKFCALKQSGSLLISSIPGFSSHLEPEYASPCTNWEKILESTLLSNGGIS